MLALKTETQRFWLPAWIAVVTVASTVGCQKFERGGGSRVQNVNGTQYNAVYGTGEARKLGFVIFTDIVNDGTVTSAGSTWTGHITPKEGLAVRYQKSGSGMNINGTQYDFNDGKLFLVSNKNGEISVTQLNTPMGDGDYVDEIDRLQNTEKVQRFFGN